MVIESFKSFAGEFLSFLERQESRLLSWGFYDVSFDAAEVDSMIEQDAEQSLVEYWEGLVEEGWTTSSLLDEMEHSGLLYRVNAETDIYRTRFAEGVRLLARLRQMFKPQDWAGGPNLVSDIKLHLAPRRYPKRDIPAEECWQDLLPFSQKPELQRAAFEALAFKRDGGQFNFANFQRQAFKHIFANYNVKGTSGSVVSAGTGSGKTKAFYIPALLGAVAELPPQQPPFTKIIAIYPRNVLLADQLREALSEAGKLRPVLERYGLRPMTFGALLGTTPESNWFERGEDGKYKAEKNNWRRVGNGFVIPFLKSPMAPDQDLVWRDEDRTHGVTALYRAGGDSTEPDVPDGTLIITREQLKVSPPDVLFLSAEMLNREMGNPEWARTFGIKQYNYSPRLLLLDEVHAYEGVSGAQVAWVLRRWRYWSGARNLHVVGLSATLKEATKHLGLVMGIAPSSIQEFRPTEQELTMEGVEYNLAVKGDPASGTSLLATSIQSGMLLTRLLTPRSVPRPSDDDANQAAFYGRKVFGFTDNLDSLNRWFSDMTDAERNLHLAKLRLHPNRRQPPVNVSVSTIRRMDEEGQIWELLSRSGHNLAQALNVSRCSSQDPGANAGSELIVASASLEVGYDDPEVGAVLHHKKPVSISSFIQRKGRAGRRVGVRPWTVVVLSDYGGDRWAFQNAERLFQPEIDTIFLPIVNPYVLRIQATYFLVDWLGRQINHGRPFTYLTYGSSKSPPVKRAISILEDFIQQGPAWHKFRNDFKQAFMRPFGAGGRALSEAEIDAVLWDAPRPLLRHVVPTLLRKLETSRRYAEPQRAGQYEDRGVNRPLPQYLPPATFADLDTVGTRLTFADQVDKEDAYLSVAKALFEACPGRVSKRYATRVGEEGYWLAFSDQLLQRHGLSSAPIGEVFPDRIFIENIDGVMVYQPQVAELTHRPADISDTSNASWHWQSLLRPATTGQSLPIFTGRPWSNVVTNCYAHLHRDQSSIEVIRFAESCEYEIRRKKTDPQRGLLVLHSVGGEGEANREAAGFRLSADGIVFHLNGEHLSQQIDQDVARTARFRPDFFLDQIRSCEVLQARINTFLAEWLWQTSVAMLSATALRNNCSLREAQSLLTGRRAAAARRVLDSIFQMRDISSQGEETEARLKGKIIDLWTDAAVVSRMEELESTLWEDAGDAYDEWVRRRYAATLAQAFRTAAVSRLRDVSEDDLTVDVIWSEQGEAAVYLTEQGSGGLGQMEMVVHELRQSPDLFQEGLRYALSFCPRHHTGVNVLSVLERAVSQDTVEVDTRTEEDEGAVKDVGAAFTEVRTAKGFQAIAQAKGELQTSLERSGLASSRSIVVALVTKLLRAGSSAHTDRVVHLLNKAWRRNSTELGIAIDPRVFAYLCVQYAPARRRLNLLFREISNGEDPTDAQLYAVLQQFLISDCHDSCPECLDHPNRFNNFGRPSRSLTLNWLDINVAEISVDAHPADWLDQVRRLLLSDGRVCVVTSAAHLANVARHLQKLLAEELEASFLLLPASITGVTRVGSYWRIMLGLKEASYVG
jgi:hypothetical protein